MIRTFFWRDHVWTSLGLFALLLAGMIGTATPVYASSHGASIQTVTLTIDGVTVTVKSAVLPGGAFATTKPGNATQRAIAVSYRPYRSFSIEAIPYGTNGDEQGLPPVGAGMAPAYRNLLSKGWKQTQPSQTAPSLTIFGQQITGKLYYVRTPLDSLTVQSALVEEWVAEAGSRIWIVRILQEETSNFSPAKLAVQTQEAR